MSVRPCSAVRLVLGRASIGAMLGAVAIGLGAQLAAAGPPDWTMASQILVAAGWGLGWIAGAALGTADAPGARTPSRAAGIVLIAAAVLVAALGGLLIREALSSAFGPMIDDVSDDDPARMLLAGIFLVDTLLLVGTLSWLVARARRPGELASAIGSGR